MSYLNTSTNICAKTAVKCLGYSSDMACMTTKLTYTLNTITRWRNVITLQGLPTCEGPIKREKVT